MSQSTISRIEAGDVGRMDVDTVRTVVQALGAKLDLVVRYHGAALDRVLDENHAVLSAAVVRILQARGWTSAIEVTFSHYGERGSIDILACHGKSRVVLVVEIKTDLGSVEDLVRRLDVKVRRAPMLATERFGVDARLVARLVVYPEDRTIQRRVERHAGVLDIAFPMTGHEVRQWLRNPSGAMSGRWFLTAMRPAGVSRKLTRIRTPMR